MGVVLLTMSQPPRSLAALFFFVGQVVNFAINFLTTPYLARSLSQHEFGTYGQVIMVLDIANILVNFGLVNSLTLAFADPKTRSESDNFATYGALFVGMGIIGSMAVWLFSYISPQIFGHQQAAPLLQWTAICVLLFYLNHLFTRALVHSSRTHYYVVATIVGNIVRVACMLIAVYAYQSLWGVLMSVSVGWVCQVAIVAASVPRRFWGGAIQKEQWLPILREGSLLGFNYQLQYAYLYVSGMLISYYLGLTQYAIYRSSSIEIPLVGTLYVAIAVIMFPHWASQARQGDYEAILTLQRRIIAQVAVLIYPVVVFMVLCSPCFIRLYLSDIYADGAPVFALVSLALLTKIGDFAELLTLRKAYHTILRINLCYFGVFLALIGLLLPVGGIIGAAAAVAISSFLLAYLYLRQTLYPLGWTLDRLLNFRHLAAILTLCLSCALPVAVLLYYWQCSIVTFLGVGVLYAVVVYAAALRLHWIDLELYAPIFQRYTLTSWLYQLLRRWAKDIK
jgi:O-antigen/teichoic acid export membrane protein